jgi:hypothetical protein
VASRVISLLEILEYVGSRREMEEWTSVSIGLPWNRMKQLGFHTTTEQTSRRQEQEFMKTCKRSIFVGLGKRQGKC